MCIDQKNEYPTEQPDINKIDTVNRGRKEDKAFSRSPPASGAVGLVVGAERSEVKPQVRKRKAFGGLFVFFPDLCFQALS